jgi:hypothetical protein
MASRDTSPTALRLGQDLAPNPALPGERRSFMGHPRVNVEPIPTKNPTNADLARGFNQIHTCLDETRGTLDRVVAALGLDDKGKPVAGLSTPRKAFIRTVLAVTTSIIVLAGAYRFLVAISPSVWALLKAVNTAILAGKI